MVTSALWRQTILVPPMQMKKRWLRKIKPLAPGPPAPEGRGGHQRPCMSLSAPSGDRNHTSSSHREGSYKGSLPRYERTARQPETVKAPQEERVLGALTTPGLGHPGEAGPASTRKLGERARAGHQRLRSTERLGVGLLETQTAPAAVRHTG